MIEETYDLTSDDGEDAAFISPPIADNGTPGLIISAEYINGISAPVIEDGVIKLPMSQSQDFDIPLVSFDEFGNSTSGLLAGATPEYDSSAIHADSGILYIPMAQSSSSILSPVPGLINGVSVKTDASPASIENGQINLPLASAPLDTTGIAGLVKNVKYDRTDQPYISGGEVILPQAADGLITASGMPYYWHNLPTSVESAVLLSEFPLFDGAVKLVASRSGNFIRFQLINE